MSVSCGVHERGGVEPGEPPAQGQQGEGQHRGLLPYSHPLGGGLPTHGQGSGLHI